ncbi:hypothetical protein J7L02_01430 [Candidatus Woesearchaeota archaeon]|nr:hypothetical protein [Candidatus Woesearchaeota archaeon]
MEDGVYSFKGFIEFLDGSKIVRVNNGILKEAGKGYVLEGDFSWDYVFEVVEDATREDIKREVASWKEVLEKKKVGDKEKPTVVKYKYKFKTGRQVLYDLEKEIVATGWLVRKEGGAYEVEASVDIPVKFVINGSLALEESFGNYYVFQEKGVWWIEGDYTTDFQAVVDLDNDVNVSGYGVEVLDKGVYKVTSSSETLVNVKTLDGKTILENAEGSYKLFKKGDSWVVKQLED